MANIYNEDDNTLLSGTSGDDTIENYGGNYVTIKAGAGNDEIYNDYSVYVTINAGDGNDSIENWGDYVTINAGTGNDSIDNLGDNSSINAGAGNDYIYNSGSDVTILAGAGNDYIYNSGSDVTILAGAGNDSIVNYDDHVTINAGEGNDYIYNSGSDVTILAGAGNDYISNYYGDNVSINAGAGKDTLFIKSAGDVTLTGGDGTDLFILYYDSDSYYGTDYINITDYAEADTIKFANLAVTSITTNGSDVTFTFGDNELVVENAADKLITYIDSDGTTKTYGEHSTTWQLDGTTATYGSLTVTGVTSLDGLSLSGSTLTVSANSLGTGKVTVSDGYTLKLGSDVSGSTTKKSWSFSNSTATLKQTTTAGYKLSDNAITYTAKATKTLATVKGVKSKDGLSVSGKVVTVKAASLGTSKVTISDGYTLKLGSDVSGSTTKKSWSFSNSTATLKQTTTAGYKLSDNAITYSAKATKTLATVKGVKSKDGLSVSGKVVTVKAASLGTSKVTISDGYTLKLGSDVSGSTTKKAFSFSNSTATLKQTTTAGYKLSDNAITYSAKATKTLATVKGVKSKDGLSVSGKVVTVKAASLGTSKVTISSGYTLKLGSDVSGSTTNKAFSFSNSTATLKQTTTAGYKLSDNAITYSAKATKTLATVKGAKSKSGLSVSGKTIKLAASALNKKVTVSGGGYTFDFASDYSTATITGSSSADTIIARGKKISVKGNAGDDTIQLLGTGTISGGSGADIFAVNSTAANVISDYAAEDKISLTSGTADFSVDGDDLIMNGKLTLSGAADKTVTYIEGGKTKTYTKPEENVPVILNDALTSATLTVHYDADDFKAADYSSSLVTIDASAVNYDLNITGNKRANKIVGGSENDKIYGEEAGDTISGGAGNDELYGGGGNDSLFGGAGNDSLWGDAGDDTLLGGDGNDIFFYDGASSDTIADYLSGDKVIVLSGKVEAPLVDSDGNVTFKIGSSGQLLFPNSANKHIELLDADGNSLKEHKP